MPTTQLARHASVDFEVVYAEARGDRGAIAWDHGRANPALVAWLNAIAPSVVRCGARVAVVGCGLGEDAVELLRRGYDVTAFDRSATAIRWARELHPEHAATFHEADLFDLPNRWRHRFDLVVEIHTIQALPIDLREETVRAISDLLSPRGQLLAICRGAEEPVGPEDGPPWALTVGELEQAAATAGLVSTDPIVPFLDGNSPPVRRIRALFGRAMG